MTITLIKSRHCCEAMLPIARPKLGGCHSALAMHCNSGWWSLITREQESLDDQHSHGMIAAQGCSGVCSGEGPDIDMTTCRANSYACHHTPNAATAISHHCGDWLEAALQSILTPSRFLWYAFRTPAKAQRHQSCHHKRWLGSCFAIYQASFWTIVLLTKSNHESSSYVSKNTKAEAPMIER